MVDFVKTQTGLWPEMDPADSKYVVEMHTYIHIDTYIRTNKHIFVVHISIIVLLVKTNMYVCMYDMV